MRAVLNMSRKQHPTKQQLLAHLPPISKIFLLRGIRNAGHSWRSKDELISDLLLWTATYGCTSVIQPSKFPYVSSVQTLDAARKTDKEQLIIGTIGQRKSVISVLSAWFHIYIYICSPQWVEHSSGEFANCHIRVIAKFFLSIKQSGDW